ncbi:CRISPR-associated protein, Csm2 family [Persephonella hydrogeniphila]|uniref:CRISPR system Cms protein Csm2 n=1 Tax=Persephonella hydrogeniphila TaxID=198703 RepID=A0A285NSH1_9AQUI|nr:type III-A CRISPR-associated protein Csm2 [Persephonella hydrogeniphila]SNZ10621.1 CRISPR-associated protein, Csm2 family [Persephonella hydrogeniphila]
MDVKDVYKEIQKIKEEKNWNNVDFLYAVNELLKKELKNKNLSDIDVESFIEPDGVAEKIAKNTTIKRSQLRKFFNQVKQLKNQISKLKPEENLHPDLRLKIVALMPKLAYAAGRKTIDKNFYFFMKNLLEKVKEGTKKDFEAFEQIFEAIIAYHTYHHPKED